MDQPRHPPAWLAIVIMRRTRMIADKQMTLKLDLIMYRFKRKCDDVLTKPGDEVARTAAWTGGPGHFGRP
jgi:hypothetical protein